jgi:hypothetical protein
LVNAFLLQDDELEVKQSTSNQNWDDEESDVMKQNAILLRRNSIQGELK